MVMYAKLEKTLPKLTETVNQDNCIKQLRSWELLSDTNFLCYPLPLS